MTDLELTPLAVAMLRHPDYKGERYSIVIGSQYNPPTLEEKLAAANHTITETQPLLNERAALKARASRLKKWCVVLTISTVALLAVSLRALEALYA